MAAVNLILRKLRLLGRADSKKIGAALQKHLEELEEQEDIAAYDKAKARKGTTEPLAAVLSRYRKPKRS